MPTLTHFSFCPHSRSVRVALAEAGLAHEAVEHYPWDWSDGFLALNPAGDLPVLELEDDSVLCGSYAISEYIDALRPTDDETPVQSMRLFPGTPAEQAEVRRLVSWFHGKMFREVTDPILGSHIVPMFKATSQVPPDAEVLRAVRANLAYHLSYLEWLSDQRNWLAGLEMSFADLAAAGQLSCMDYLGEVDWARYPAAKIWYQRLKSRRSFQSLLADRIPGRAPASDYVSLDF